MAILSALISFVGRKAGDLFQAILGWSVTALFGRLPSLKQTALSVTLVASLLWPVLLVGIFVPAVTSWMFAATPVHQWVGEDVVRIASLVLALVLPAVIGLAMHRIAPPRVRRGGIARTVLGGYPLTLGFALACLVTALTVPIVKILSAVKRWKDEHTFVQPIPGRYAAAVEELARACKAAGLEPEVEEVPWIMTLGTRVLLWFARGTLDALVADCPKRVRAEHLELYLYPGDLLLRGAPQRVAQVRAKMTRTALLRAAYLVADTAAQRLQDDIVRLWDLLEDGRTQERGVSLAQRRLAEVTRALEAAQIPFEEWAILDRELLRLEHGLAGGRRVESDAADALPDAPVGVSRQRRDAGAPAQSGR